MKNAENPVGAASKGEVGPPARPREGAQGIPGSSSTVGDASWPQLVDSKQGDACQREILVSRLICK